MSNLASVNGTPSSQSSLRHLHISILFACLVRETFEMFSTAFRNTSSEGKSTNWKIVQPARSLLRTFKSQKPSLASELAISSWASRVPFNLRLEYFLKSFLCMWRLSAVGPKVGSYKGLLLSDTRRTIRTRQNGSP